MVFFFLKVNKIKGPIYLSIPTSSVPVKIFFIIKKGDLT